MKELIVLVLCFVLYVVAVEVYEARVDAGHARPVAQQQGFVYVPAPPPTSADGTSVVSQLNNH